MARGTDFGGVHSYLTLNLIQQKVEIAPAEPKMNLLDIPGADGSKDLSTLPSGKVRFHDRTITWTFALYPGENWDEAHHRVSNALNGRECRITLDTDPDYYYFGRLAVRSYRLDRLLRQIIVEATCRPYALKQEPTRVVVSLSGDTTRVVLRNSRKPVLPTFSATVQTEIQWNGSRMVIAPGAHTLFIELEEGDNLLEVKASDGATGTLTITYQEGVL